MLGILMARRNRNDRERGKSALTGRSPARTPFLTEKADLQVGLFQNEPKSAYFDERRRARTPTTPNEISAREEGSGTAFRLRNADGPINNWAPGANVTFHSKAYETFPGPVDPIELSRSLVVPSKPAMVEAGI